ncbi:MAG: hypothetical protein V3U72_03635 [Candidatus Aenigmarchaeota archaeon]
MTTYFRTFKVESYCGEHARLSGSMARILDGCLLTEGGKSNFLKKVEIYFNDDPKPMSYDSENPIDACDIIERLVDKGEKITIHLTVPNERYKKACERIFRKIQKESIDKEFYEGERGPEKKSIITHKRDRSTL